MDYKINNELSQEFQIWLSEKGLLGSCSSALLKCKIFDLYDLGNYMFPPMLFGNPNQSTSTLINELDVDSYLNLQMEFLKFHTDFWNEPLPSCDEAQLTRFTTDLSEQEYNQNFMNSYSQEKDYLANNYYEDINMYSYDNSSDREDDQVEDDKDFRLEIIHKSSPGDKLYEHKNNNADLNMQGDENVIVMEPSMFTSAGKLRKDRPRKEVSEEKRKKMDHANELLKRRRKAKQLESLRVPDDDIRRTFMKEFFSLINSHNFIRMKIFLESNSEKNFVYRFDQVNFEAVQTPKKIEIHGIEGYLSYLRTMSVAVPDGIFRTKDVFIRNTICNRIRHCSIHATVFFDCTSVYEILLQSKPQNCPMKWVTIAPFRSDIAEETITLNDLKTIISSIKAKTPLDTVNLTHIRDTTEKIEISTTRNNNFEFNLGNMLTRKAKVVGTGLLVFHLSEMNKIYLIDFRVIRKTVVYLS